MRKKQASANPEPTKPKKKRIRQYVKETPGRPCELTDQVADYICEEIAKGRSLRSICRRDKLEDETNNAPGLSTVIRWLADDRHVTFRAQYTRAREAQADALFDEIIDIADNSTQDRRKVDGKYEVDHEAIQRSRLRVDARKWMAGKLRPKVYGDKVDVALGGVEGGSPVQVSHKLDASALSDATIKDLMRARRGS